MKHEHFCGHRPFNILKITLFALGGILLALLFGLAFGWVVQYLWNHIVVSLFSIRAISYLEAVGIIVLCKLLFGGMHHSHHPHYDKRDRMRRKDYRHLHEFFGENRDDIASFWESEGREAFRKFRENRKTETNDSSTE